MMKWWLMCSFVPGNYTDIDEHVFEILWTLAMSQRSEQRYEAIAVFGSFQPPLLWE